jgi:hypothetical protein
VHFPSAFVASEKSPVRRDGERRAFTITRRRFEKLRAGSLFTGDEREQLRADEVAIAIAWRELRRHDATRCRGEGDGVDRGRRVDAEALVASIHGIGSPSWPALLIAVRRPQQKSE